MKQNLKNGFVFALIMALCAIIGVIDGSSVLMAEAIATPSRGVVETNQIMTTTFSRKNSEDFLLNEIERKVVVIRPMGNPLETIARYAESRPSKSQKVQYYSTDVLPAKAKLAKKYTEETVTGAEQATIDTSNNNIFSVYETILIPGMKGWDETGTKKDENSCFVLYVVKKTDEGKLVVKPVNGKKIGDVSNSMPTIEQGTNLIRAGRAHNEIDMQTTPYAVVPTKSTQYLQIFRAQIEETTLHKISDKEVDWTFSDQEKEAIFDMKRCMNKSFMMGAKRIIFDANSKEVFLTGGIWWLAGKEFVYGKSGSDLQFDHDELVELSKMAFTGNNGNKDKIFIVGSNLMANLNKIKVQKNIIDVKTETRLGLTFRVIETNFGQLYTILDESLDELGLTNGGLIFDPDYLKKYRINELEAKDLDLKKSGQKNVDARVIEEISGLILQNPLAHVRVIPHA